MSDLRDRLSMFFSAHADFTMAVLALIVLALCAITWLWGRRAMQLERHLARERAASRAMLPLPREKPVAVAASTVTGSPPEPRPEAANRLVERSGRAVYSVAKRVEPPITETAEPVAKDAMGWALPPSPPSADEVKGEAPAALALVGPLPAEALGANGSGPEANGSAHEVPHAYAAWGAVVAPPPTSPGPAPLPWASAPTEEPALPDAAVAPDPAPAPPEPVSTPPAGQPDEPAPDALAWYRPPDDATDATEADAGADLLLVEDDENVTSVYRLLLENRGYRVRGAADGLAGLEEARRHRPSLILLDVMMPHMNGILFLKALRAEPELESVPVVILSNFKEPRLVERALALGALEYLVKADIRPDALLSAIPGWLRGSRAFAG